MLSCDHIESAKFIHNTLSRAKIVYYIVFWLRLGDPSVRQSPIGIYVCHFLGQMLGSEYAICSYGQI